MAELGAVTYNQSRGLIEPGEHIETYLWYLARATDSYAAVTEPRPRYYGVLSVLAVAGLGGAIWLEPHTTVPLIELAVAGIVAAFGSCTGWYLWSEQRAAEIGTTATI